MSKLNKERSMNTSFWMFPERINSIVLFLISLLSLTIVIIIGVLIFSNRKYIYIPEYETIKYSEDINTVINVLSNYTETDDEFSKTNRIILGYCKTEKNNNDYNIINTTFNLKGYIDGEVEYLSEYTKTSKFENYYTTYSLSSLTSNSKLDYEQVFVKTSYDYVDNDNNVTRKVQNFKQDFISLEENEYKNVKVDEISEQAAIFDKHEVTRASDSDDKYKISATLYMNYKKVTNFKTDYQLFGIDDTGNIYTLIGYYNISNNVGTKSNYTRSITLPKDMNINKFIAKANYLDENGVLHTFISKVNVE